MAIHGTYYTLPTVLLLQYLHILSLANLRHHPVLSPSEPQVCPDHGEKIPLLYGKKGRWDRCYCCPYFWTLQSTAIHFSDYSSYIHHQSSFLKGLNYFSLDIIHSYGLNTHPHFIVSYVCIRPRICPSSLPWSRGTSNSNPK